MLPTPQHAAALRGAPWIGVKDRERVSRVLLKAFTALRGAAALKPKSHSLNGFLNGGGTGGRLQISSQPGIQRGGE